MIKIKSTKFTEFCGWTGMILILLAYGLLSFAIIESNSVVFQALNLVGALGFIVVAASKGVKQSVIINIIWSAIALIALYNIIL